MDVLISIEEASRRLQEVATVCQVEQVALDRALGRVVAVDVQALLDVPHFDRAMLDGFAVKAADIVAATKDQPVELRVLETVGAGHVPHVQVKTGTAVRTMTGAPIVTGADAIVRIEYAEELTRDNERIVRIYRAVDEHEAIQEQGHDILAGHTLLTSGTLLQPMEIAVLAAHGYHTVTVTRQPRVAIVATGSEVVPLGQALQLGQLYNSNTPMLTALVTQAGAQAISFSPASDHKEELTERFMEALETCDILVTTGGVSVGDYDLTPSILEEIGVKRLFWGVWMRPGTPVYAGTFDGRLVLALSGNPAAAFINAIIFLVPLLRVLAGQKDEQVDVKARLKNPPQKRRVKHTRFFAGQLIFIENELWIDVSGEHSSGVMTNFIGKMALAQIGGEDELREGELVSVILL